MSRRAPMLQTLSPTSQKVFKRILLGIAVWVVAMFAVQSLQPPPPSFEAQMQALGFSIIPPP